MEESTIEFYEDERGRRPFQAFLDDLDSVKKLAMIAAIEQILARQGMAVCRSSWGTALGEGLPSHRRRDPAAVRP